MFTFFHLSYGHLYLILCTLFVCSFVFANQLSQLFHVFSHDLRLYFQVFGPTTVRLKTDFFSFCISTIISQEEKKSELSFFKFHPSLLHGAKVWHHVVGILITVMGVRLLLRKGGLYFWKTPWKICQYLMGKGYRS